MTPSIIHTDPLRSASAFVAAFDDVLAQVEAAVCYWIRLESIGAVNKHERMGLMLRADEWRTAELEAVEELWK